MKHNEKCDVCCGTGIISATLVREPETGEKKVVVKPCDQHFGSKLLEKNIAAIGLPVVVLDAGSKKEA